MKTLAPSAAEVVSDALGAGRPFFPALSDRVELQLAETRTFASGVVYLGYETLR